MPEAYDAAARRHFTDATQLAGQSRYDNAGHLIGFAAECALKHAYDITEPADESPKVHLPALGLAILKRVQSRNPKHQSLRMLLEQTKAGYFNDWQVSDRYSADGVVTKAKYERWESFARRTLGAAGIKP